MDPHKWGVKDEKAVEHTEVWIGDKINFYWGPVAGWVIGIVVRRASSAELRAEI